MKVKLDIDCTPEEARTLLGLPDIAPMQQRFLERVEERLEQNLEALEPEAFFRSWFPVTAKGMDDLRGLILGGAKQAATQGAAKGESKRKEKG